VSERAEARWKRQARRHNRLKRRPRHRRGWRRWTRLALEAVLGVVAGLVILLGFLAWRLSEGPVTLNFLTPRLVEAFRMGDDGKVSIDQTMLVWNEERSSLDLRVRGLTIANAADEPQLVLPESNLELSIGALLSGEIEVVALEVFDAELTLRRDPDGRFAWLGSGSGSGGSALLMKEVMGGGGTAGGGAGDGADALASLQTVRLLRPVVHFDDQVAGQTLRLPGREIVIERTPQGLSGSATLTLSLDEQQSPISLAFAYSRKDGLIDISAQVAAVSLMALSRSMPELAFLERLDGQVAGAISMTMAGAGGLAVVGFDLSLGAGILHLGGGPERDLALSSGQLQGLYDYAAGKLTVDRLVLVPRLPDGSVGPQFEAAGQLQAEGPRRFRGALTATAAPFSTAQLLQLWPAWIAPGGYQWVQENLAPAGQVSDITTDLGFHLDEAGFGVTHLSGGFAYSGLEAHFLRPLPPVTAVSGRATFDDQGLDFTVDGGALVDIELLPSRVVFYGLDGRDQRLKVNAHASGSLPTITAILETKPLQLMSQLGMPLTGGRGEADFILDLDMGLLGQIKLADIAISADATLRNLAFDEVYSGLPLEADRLTLQVDNEALHLKGPARIAGAAVDLAWRERFTGGTKLDLSGSNVEVKTLAALWPELAEHATGAVGGSLHLEGRRDRAFSLAADLDLGGIAVDLPDLEWKKAAGAPAKAALTLRFDKGVVVAIEPLSFEAEGLSGAGQLAFADGQVSEISFQHLEVLGHSLVGLWARPWGDGWQLRFDGGKLDARPYMERLEGERDAKLLLPLLIEPSHIDEVLLPGGSLVAASISGERLAEGYQRLELGADVVGGTARGRIDVKMTPDAQGHRHLELATDNMGSLLSALGIADNIAGGKMRIVAQATGPGADSRMEGQVEGTDFRLMKAPVLANILLIASLSGIVDALDGEGISFSRLTGDIAFADGVLTSSLMKLYGGSLGVTTKGSVDFGADVVDLEGSIVPAYAVNQVLGEIPVIGWLLTGGEGGGLLAVSYRVSGPVSQPEISVNPLSALTPGFLRGLYDLFEGDGTPPPATLYPDGPTR
jgi:hypothetical protein